MAARLEAERAATEKAARAREPAWWPKEAKVVPKAPKRRPASPRTVEAAERRLEQIKMRMDAGHELTAEEMNDAAAIFELRKIWAALEQELREERLEKERTR